MTPSGGRGRERTTSDTSSPTAHDRGLGRAGHALVHRGESRRTATGPSAEETHRALIAGSVRFVLARRVPLRDRRVPIAAK